MHDMQSHLETGCKECQADLEVWTHVTSLAAGERAFEPPSSAVQVAKAVIAFHVQPTRLPIAKLLFDSMSTPALVGVRSSSSTTRQMLYGFEDYRVDLRFDPNFDCDHALLVGQVLNSRNSNQSLGKIAVSLTRGDQILGVAKTNDFGEFQMECDLGSRLELELTLPDGVRLRVPMIEPIAGASEANPSQRTARKRLTSNRKTHRKSTRK